MEKVAFFIDWENFKQDIYTVQKVTKRRVFDFHQPNSLVKLFKAFLQENERIYRIFFYTSYPLEPDFLYNTVIERKNFSKYNISLFNKYYAKNREDMTKFYNENKNFLDQLACEDYIAMRAGELKVRGLNFDGMPIIEQKQVDMLMGLDIAHVSYRHHVDKVIIFSKDTDIKPALKTARLNGVQTVIGCLEKGYKVPDILRKHCDYIRIRTLNEIFQHSFNKNNTKEVKALNKPIQILNNNNINTVIKNVKKEKVNTKKREQIKNNIKKEKTETVKNIKQETAQKNKKVKRTKTNSEVKKTKKKIKPSVPKKKKNTLPKKISSDKKNVSKNEEKKS